MGFFPGKTLKLIFLAQKQKQKNKQKTQTKQQQQKNHKPKTNKNHPKRNHYKKVNPNNQDKCTFFPVESDERGDFSMKINGGFIKKKKKILKAFGLKKNIFKVVFFG